MAFRLPGRSGACQLRPCCAGQGTGPRRTTTNEAEHGPLANKVAPPWGCLPSAGKASAASSEHLPGRCRGPVASMQVPTRESRAAFESEKAVPVERKEVLVVDGVRSEAIATEPTQTVRSGLGGQRYEMDLSDQNAAELRESFARFIAAATTSGAAQDGEPGCPRERTTQRTTADRGGSAIARSPCQGSRPIAAPVESTGVGAVPMAGAARWHGAVSLDSSSEQNCPHDGLRSGFRATRGPSYCVAADRQVDGWPPSW